MMIVSLLVQPIDWRNKQPPLSLNTKHGLTGASVISRSPEHCKMLFSTGTKSAAKVWDVGGHDTTSSLFSVGKGLPMQKLKESPLF